MDCKLIENLSRLSQSDTGTGVSPPTMASRLPRSGAASVTQSLLLAQAAVTSEPRIRALNGPSRSSTALRGGPYYGLLHFEIVKTWYR